MTPAKWLLIFLLVGVGVLGVSQIGNTQTTTLPQDPGNIATGNPINASDVLGNDQALLAGLRALEALIGIGDGAAVATGLFSSVQS